MSLLAQAAMTEDSFLIVRIASAASREGVRDARIWAVNNIWEITAVDGWADAYLAASGELSAGDPAAAVYNTGRDESVITDEQIRDSVRAVLERATQESQRPPQEPPSTTPVSSQPETPSE